MRFIKYTIRDRAGHLKKTGMYEAFDRRAKHAFISASEAALKQGHVVTTERCNRDGTAWGALTEAEQFDVAKIQAAQICADPAKLDAFMEAHPLPIPSRPDGSGEQTSPERLKKRARDLKYRQARRAREKATRELAKGIVKDAA